MSIYQSKKNNDFVVPYGVEKTFKALLTSLEKCDNIKIKQSNATTHTISAKTGVSWKSWGEDVSLVVIPHPSGSSITMNSNTKYGVIDWGKNQDNFDFIIKALTEELAHDDYKPFSIETNHVNDIPTQIKQLAELLEQGLLTESEYNDKKTELLSRM